MFCASPELVWRSRRRRLRSPRAATESYFQIAQDIKNVAGKEGMEVSHVYCLPGSLENIQLLGTGKVDLRIVTAGRSTVSVSDVLKQQKNLDLFDSIKGCIESLPREIHVSATRATSQTFYQSRREAVSVAPEEAEPRLRRGALVRLRLSRPRFLSTRFGRCHEKAGVYVYIDAVMFVAGAPVPLSQVGRQRFILSVCRQTRHSSKSCTNEPGEISISCPATIPKTYACRASIMGLD